MKTKGNDLKDVLVKPRLWPLLLWLVVCIPFAVGSFFLGFDTLQSDKETLEKVRLIALSTFFPILFILVVRRVFNRTAVLLIQLDGLTVFPDSERPIRIKWQDVSGLTGHRVRYQKFLGISVHDRAEVLERSDANETGLTRLVGKLRFSDFDIPLFGSRTDPEQLIELIRQRIAFLKEAAQQQTAAGRDDEIPVAVGK